MKKFRIYIILGLLCAFAIGWGLCRSCTPKPQPAEPIIKRDTVIIRDTIRPSVPKPQVVTVVRRDTVRLAVVPEPDATAPPDSVQVEIPISQSVYQTDDYRATVEGYDARLVDMEIYRQITVITNTVPKWKSPRWALTIGPGVGYGPNGWQPYIGVSVGFVIFSK